MGAGAVFGILLIAPIIAAIVYAATCSSSEPATFWIQPDGGAILISVTRPSGTTITVTRRRPPARRRSPARRGLKDLMEEDDESPVQAAVTSASNTPDS